jgi:hypothetical protein
LRVKQRFLANCKLQRLLCMRNRPQAALRGDHRQIARREQQLKWWQQHHLIFA